MSNCIFYPKWNGFKSWLKGDLCQIPFLCGYECKIHSTQSYALKPKKNPNLFSLVSYKKHNCKYSNVYYVNHRYVEKVNFSSIQPHVKHSIWKFTRYVPRTHFISSAELSLSQTAVVKVNDELLQSDSLISLCFTEVLFPCAFIPFSFL